MSSSTWAKGTQWERKRYHTKCNETKRNGTNRPRTKRNGTKRKRNEIIARTEADRTKTEPNRTRSKQNKTTGEQQPPASTSTSSLSQDVKMPAMGKDRPGMVSLHFGAIVQSQPCVALPHTIPIPQAPSVCCTAGWSTEIYVGCRRRSAKRAFETAQAEERPSEKSNV